MTEFTAPPRTVDMIAAIDRARPTDRYSGARVTVALWVSAVGIGLCCALVASVTETTTHWITDGKTGRCSDFPFATREMCCVAQPGLSARNDQSTLDAVLGGNAAVQPCSQWARWGITPGATLSPSTDISSAVYSSVNGFLVYCIASVTLACLAAFLAYERPAVAGSGIVELKAYLSGVDLPGMFVPEVLLRKALGLCAAVGSGLAVGKEGPFVHLGACVAATVAYAAPALRDSPLFARELLSSGAAAGVAVAFGAPLGGVLFVLEESGFTLRRRAVLMCLVAASVAALTLRTIDASGTGRIVQFAVSHRLSWQWFELPLFALLGFVGGVVGVGIVIANGWLYRAPRREEVTAAVVVGSLPFRLLAWLRHIALTAPIQHVAVIAALSACVSYGSPLLRRGMLEVLHDLFVECDHQQSGVITGDRATDAICAGDSSTAALFSLLLMAALVKALLMVIVIGAKIPQGCFVPSLFVGAALGRALGTWVQAVYRANPTLAFFASCGGDVAANTAQVHMVYNSDCIAPGIYAMIGAAALLTGVTRMTLSIAVIMFELTGGLEYVGPCLLASLVAKYTAEALLCAPSLYDLQLLRSNLPYMDIAAADGGYDAVLDLNIAEILPTTPSEVVVLWHGMTFEELRRTLDQGRTRCGTPPRWFPVVLTAHTSEFMGCISRDEVLRLVAQATTAGTNLLTPVAFSPPLSGACVGGGLSGSLQWSNALDPCTPRLSTAATIRHALIAFSSLGVHHVVLCRGVNFAALLTRRDVFGFLKEKEREVLRSATSVVGRGGAAAAENDGTGELVPVVVGVEGDRH